MSPVYIPGHFARAGVNDRYMGPDLNLKNPGGLQSAFGGSLGNNAESKEAVETPAVGKVPSFAF